MDSQSACGKFCSPTVTLRTAETIILTSEVRRHLHLLPLCREMKLKQVKSKDKNELAMILAKELLCKKKKVILKPDADFYCLHHDSVFLPLVLCTW